MREHDVRWVFLCSPTGLYSESMILWVRSSSGFNASEARVSVNLNKKRFGREREEDERRAGESEGEGERILSPLNTNIRACSHNKSIFIINILHSFLRQRLQPAVSSHFNTAARLSTFLSWRTVICSHPGTVLVSGVSAEKRRIKIIFVVLSTAHTAGNKPSRLRLQLGSSHLHWTELRTERSEKQTDWKLQHCCDVLRGQITRSPDFHIWRWMGWRWSLTGSQDISSLVSRDKYWTFFMWSQNIFDRKLRHFHLCFWRLITRTWAQKCSLMIGLKNG